jgi:cob(I)alamin adenosyltransferase
MIMAKLKKGLIHIYTGKGKGKTTASLGLALRAVSSGLKVCMFQFLKKRGTSSDGWLEFPNFRIVCLNQEHPIFSGSRTNIIRPLRKLSGKIKKDLLKIKRIMRTGKYDVIILDEILNCVSERFIEETEVLRLLKAKPAPVEIVLTGRGATSGLVSVSDYVTRLDKVKHPFDRGQGARKGIEY